MDTQIFIPQVTEPVSLKFRLTLVDDQGYMHVADSQVYVLPVANELGVSTRFKIENRQIQVILKLAEPAAKAISLDYRTEDRSAQAG